MTTHPLAQITADECDGKRFYELLSFRESILAEILQAARSASSFYASGLTNPGTLRALLLAFDRLDAVDARLKELAPHFTLKGTRNAGETHPA